MENFSSLEFRGEGNCAIVFANPQTNQVYRLLKYNATYNMRKLLQNGFNSEIHTDVKNIQSVVKSKLARIVSFMTNIMRPLLTEQYVVTPYITSIPVGFGENAVALAGEARPAHRKISQFDTVDSDILYALVLPDCCFVHHSDSSSLKQKTHSDSTEADDSFDSPGPSESEIMSSKKINVNSSFCFGDSQESTSDLCDESIDISCADDVQDTEQYTYCPNSYVIDTNSPPHLYVCSDSSRSLSSSSSIYSSPSEWFQHGEDNNRRGILDDEHFTLSIEIKPKKAFMTKASSDSSDSSQVCRFCMHQPLKRKSGMWPETSSYCPIDLFSGNKQRMKHALLSLIKTPQNNLKICKDGNEIYGSDIHMDLNPILQNWFPVNPSRRQRLISVFLDLVIEILLSTHDNVSDCDSFLPKLQPQLMPVQKCANSSFVYQEEDDTSQDLPHGCVLERIFSLQALDDLDIEGVFPLYTRLKKRLELEPDLSNKWCLNGPYDNLSWLFGAKGEQLDDLDPDSDDYAALKVKRFLVSKTLQDCSVIAAIKPVIKSTQNKGDLIRFEGDIYEFSIKVIDLDPKPFEKVKTYYRQASEIAATFAEITSGCGGNCSSR